jgi:uncharacterized membrane protein
VLPDPLHPAVVHLPIALAILVPIVAAFALVAARIGLVPARGWAFVVLLQALLVATAWLALETGEADEERAETVIAGQPIEDHEERAERLMFAAVAGLLVLAAGLVLALGVAALAADVGHSGGALVYEHGAAAAYAKP